VKNLNFLFAAYTMIWGCLSVFLLRLASKIAKLEKEVSMIEEKYRT